MPGINGSAGFCDIAAIEMAVIEGKACIQNGVVVGATACGRIAVVA